MFDHWTLCFLFSFFVLSLFYRCLILCLINCYVSRVLCIFVNSVIVNNKTSALMQKEKISQGLDREPPSLSPYFLLIAPITHGLFDAWPWEIWVLVQKAITITLNKFWTTAPQKQSHVLAYLKGTLIVRVKMAILLQIVNVVVVEEKASKILTSQYLL